MNSKAKERAIKEIMTIIDETIEDIESLKDNKTAEACVMVLQKLKERITKG